MPKEPSAAGRRRSIYPAIFLAAGLYVVVNNFQVAAPILLAFFLIVLLSLALNPVMARLRDLFGRRSIGMALVAAVFLALAGCAGWAFYKPVRASAARFAHRFPEYWQQVEQPLRKIEGELESWRSTARTFQGAASTRPDEASPGAEEGSFHFDRSQWLNNIGRALQSLISNTATLLLVAITVLAGVVFTLLNPRPVVASLFRWIPQQHQEASLRVAYRFARFVPRWALAMLLAMASVGLLVFVAMWPIFGFQEALILGIIATVFEAIPYVGPILSGIPALLLATAEGGWMPLWVVLVYVGIQLIEHNVINPVIVAGRLRQHPVAVIFSVLICVSLFGVLGVLLAVPLVAALDIINQEIYRPRFLPAVQDKEIEEMARRALNGAGAMPAGDAHPAGEQEGPVNKPESVDR